MMIGALAASLCIAAGASSASAATEGQKFGSWTVNCEDGGKMCHISQRLVTKQDDRTLISVGVGKVHGPNGESASQMIIVAPLGILLPQALTLQIDQSQPVKLPFLQCTPNGCRTVVTLEAEGLQKLQAGSEAKFTYFLPNGQPVTLPISLSGFTAGYNEVAK
jgi:invasion protein IalB